jgi:hypothetical protein
MSESQGSNYLILFFTDNFICSLFGCIYLRTPYIARLFAHSLVTDSLFSCYSDTTTPLSESRTIIEKYHSNATMSSNLENDGLVGLRNDGLDRDGLAMVVDDDNY